MADESIPLGCLTPYEAQVATAVFERLFPADETGPGATVIGVVGYLDRALAGPYRDLAPAYRLGFAALDRVARARVGRPFAAANAAEQDALLADLERGALPEFAAPPQQEFFGLLRAHLQEGLFADPVHGGNRDAAGWRLLGHPGVWLANSAEENLAPEPVTKGGEVRTLRDVGYAAGGAAYDDGLREPVTVAGYDPQRGAAPPEESADVVLVGVGAVGSVIAPVLAAAGLRVVGLEAGPWRTKRDFLPDELSSAYYCRGDMGPKFLAERPRWRRTAGEPCRPAAFTLGRMMNGVGGSVIHWGGALRRNHPHHFRYRSWLLERYGEAVLPPGTTVADWPVGYDDLAPYYTRLEHHIGVAGDARSNPFLPPYPAYPLPPVRPFTMGEMFRGATASLGLHPYPTPVAVNTEPYRGFPTLTYSAWTAGFGPFDDERWYPALNSVPEALATGNFDLRTHCRVVRVRCDRDGHADGVEYVDANGERRVQPARTVILCGYTFENVRLMLLSADDPHPGGLGNNRGQLGAHFMTKAWADVYGYFPDVVFNAHTGPAAQMWSLDDYVAAEFDSVAHGFVGGATPNVENQRLPIQISREPVPPGVPGWGLPYKHAIQRWQHVAAVRLQPDALPYECNRLDLDPVHRDRSGLGLPVVRITYDLQDNERRLDEWMERAAGEILRAMGAREVWRGARFGGVCSSHDLGGARMGEDPAGSVVDPDLQVHDTPGLYVFSGAVFPTCHGVNPTLTLFALCLRAAEGLAQRLRAG